MLVSDQVVLVLVMHCDALKDNLVSEYLLSYISPKHDEPDIQNTSTIILQAEDNTSSGSSEEFLKSRLRFTKDVHGQDICLVKAGDDEVGVMMGWERGISECGDDNLLKCIQPRPSAGDRIQTLR